jgi:hypothetical protein
MRTADNQRSPEQIVEERHKVKPKLDERHLLALTQRAKDFRSVIHVCVMLNSGESKGGVSV